MNGSSNTTAELDQADEEILTDTVSDEALEAAAGTGEEAERWQPPTLTYHPHLQYCC